MRFGVKNAVMICVTILNILEYFGQRTYQSYAERKVVYRVLEVVALQTK